MTKRANVLTVSLIAIFAVTSVRAEIASKAYVDQQVDSVEAKVDTHTANTTMHITAAERTAWNAKEDASNKVTSTENYNADIANADKYPNMPVVNQMISDTQVELTSAVSLKQDKSDSTVSGTLRQGTYLTGGTGVGANLKALDTAIGNEETARANADTAINNKIGTVTEGKTVVQMIQDAQSAATYDDTALAGRVTAVETGKADKATTLAGYGITNAYTKSEVDTSLGNKQNKSDSTVAADGNYIKAGSDVKANLGLLDTRAKANADAISAETTRATTAEGAINTKIGTVTEGKTVVQMIQDAQSAATYDDTALAGRVTATEGAITTLNGDATTTGSVAKKIADAISDLDLANTYETKAHVGTIPNGSSATTVIGYVDEKAAAAAAAAVSNANLGTMASEDKNDYYTKTAADTKFVEAGAGVTQTTTENYLVKYDAQGLVTGGVAAGALAKKDTVAKTDLAAALKTEIEGKADASSLGTAAAANVSTTGVGANETNLVTGQQVQTAITNLDLGNTYQAKSASTVANGTYNYISQGNAVASNLVALDTAAKNAKGAADAAAETANAAIPKPSGTCTDCVLHFNGTAYAWEEVGR